MATKVSELISENNHNDAPASQNRSPFMSVREIADYLHINTKKVYALVAEGKIPATKVTGKWLFPRKLIDQWVMESSHGGLLTDRLVIAGSDDPLLQRALNALVIEMQGRALVTNTCAGTELGLSLLARNRADVAGVRWGPAEESQRRHTALLRAYPPHRNWILVRAFEREQGILINPNLFSSDEPGVDHLFQSNVRWAMRQQGGGAQRFLSEVFGRHQVDPAHLRITTRTLSERETGSILAQDKADAAPGARSTATEFGLDFVSVGWEAYDFALDRGIYFRKLFQRLVDALKGPDCQQLARTLGGYNFSGCGQIIWSA